MTFCKRRVCRASAKDELQTIGRPPSQLGGAGRSADYSQLYALQFYTARCKHSALRAPCSQRFTPESGALRPTLMPEASLFCCLLKAGRKQALSCGILRRFHVVWNALQGVCCVDDSDEEEIVQGKRMTMTQSGRPAAFFVLWPLVKVPLKVPKFHLRFTSGTSAMN